MRATGKLVVFVGPTLTPAEVRKAAPGCVVLPPARQGDVWRALPSRPRALALIDGFFDTQPSVWHHELLDALDAGVPVFGGGSMGALRAAELEPFGMVGVGKIFEGFRDGTLEDDSEVALLQSPPEHGNRPLTVAMVNVRAAAEQARKRRALTPAQAKALVRAGAATFYQRRSWAELLARLGWPAPVRAKFERFLATAFRDQKALDAVACLKAAAKAAERPVSASPRVQSSWVRRRKLLDVDPSGELEDLHASAAGQAVAEQGTRTLLLAAMASQAGLVPTTTELAAAESEVLARARVKWHDRAKHYAKLGLDAAEVRRLCRTLALERLALENAERLVPDGPNALEGLALMLRTRGGGAVPARP